MKRPETNNITAYVQGKNLNVFQKADAVIEYNKLLDYVEKLEKAITVTRCCKSDSEQLCEHPRSERSYIGQNKLRCNKCGKEFS